ncbi:MAG: alpha-mannosidase [Clostridia bacterium]|nr:alpha-mannosidase [Clostridia bacterium]
MAHIKVVRRSMRPEEWINLRFGWLKRYIYKEKHEIDTFVIKDARQVSEMNFEFYDGEFRALKKGDMYFTPDGTAFIEADYELPAHLEGKEFCFALKTAAEMIVKVNGVYVGGIDPNRERINLSDYVEGKRLHFEIMGYNRSKPDDERNPESLSVRGCRQIFEGGYIAVVNKAVQSLVYDLELLTDAALSEVFNEDFSALVIRELDAALNLIDFDDVRDEDVLAASDYIDKNIFSNKDYKGSGSVALVAHSHLDIAYYWRRIHAVQKNLRTVLIQLRLMDKYRDFKYAHTQAYTYETVEKYYPEIFEELKKRISEGRFEPVGAMYVEPDCNIPSCESLIRQCLYGQSYFREKFGLTVNNCWLPDVFGNSWILPQILKKSGVDYFVSNKMSTWNDTNRFPHNNFIWRGIDGSEVYACVPPTHFISWNMPSQVQENWEAYQDKNEGGQTLQMFGYGDGGSGATEEMIELMHRFEKLSVMPETEHTTGSEFLKKNFEGNDKLATWDGELYLEMHRGTFTTKSKLKEYNRRLEFMLRDAELLSVLRIKKGEAYPAEKIREIYKKLLINQFHDILPGSHITPVYRDAIADYEEIEKELCTIIGTGSEYFNTLNFKRKNLTFIPNENGEVIRRGEKGYYAIPDIDALSSGKVSAKNAAADWISVNGYNVETPFYSAEFDADGSFVSLRDKSLCREWVKGDFNKLKMYHDTPGNYDAWDILPNYKDRPCEFTVKKPVEFVKADGECAEFSVIFATEKSEWQMIIRFFRQSKGIEVEHIVDWNEKHKLVKAEYGCNVLSRELICDTSAGIIRRETHRNTSWQQARFEVCHHKWCDMAEQGGGIALINQGKYGVSAENNVMALSLLRSTIRPDPTSDMGEHDFCYMIYPHAGDAVSAEINKKAFEYNIPLRKADVTANLPDFGALWLQSVKLSENGKKIVVRLCEQNGERGAITLPEEVEVLNMLEDEIGKTDRIEYSPFEIITVALNKEC